MDLVPILSLVVAALALFVGPILSARSAKRAMLGPMRQQWINDLRSTISEISSSCLYYFQAGHGNRTESEYKRICDLEHKIIFLINPNEIEHQKLIQVIHAMVSTLEKGKENDSEFISSYEQLLEDGRHVLKKEWNVIKKS